MQETSRLKELINQEVRKAPGTTAIVIGLVVAVLVLLIQLMIGFLNTQAFIASAGVFVFVGGHWFLYLWKGGKLIP